MAIQRRGSAIRASGKHHAAAFTDNFKNLAMQASRCGRKHHFKLDRMHLVPAARWPI
jgi:hypothetical protein